MYRLDGMGGWNLVAIVTGAGGTIGRAVCHRLARKMPIAVWDVSAAAAEETTSTLVDAEHDVRAFVVDVAEPVAVERAYTATVQMGLPSVLVNNAGIREIVPFLALDPMEWRRVLATDLDGYFYCLSQFARGVARAGGIDGAAVVNIASSSSVRAFRNRTAYVSAKHGVVGLTRAAALDLAALGIRVNAVAPGFIKTALTAGYEEDPAMAALVRSSTPLDRWGTPEDVALAVEFLIGDRSPFITGEVLAVDGGLLASQADFTRGRDQGHSGDQD